MTEGLHRFYGGNDLHFLTFSCHRRQPLFRNEAHRDLFLKILDRVRRRYRLVVLGYVVMPEHVHLLVSEPQRETLSTAIQALKIGIVRSLRCSTGSILAAAPRSRWFCETLEMPPRMFTCHSRVPEVLRHRPPMSRKSGETWGTRLTRRSSLLRQQRELRTRVLPEVLRRVRESS
jgi:REP element-mobilizing transposase RayT